MKIGYLGPAGSYTEEAAAQRFAKGQLIAFNNIEDVFEAVAAQDVAYGVVPSENMIQGPVTETQDGLYSHHAQVRIIDMVMMPISHALGTSGDLKSIQQIFSKDQALKQCSKFIQSNLHQAELIEVDSTSSAIIRVKSANDPTQAAIGSPRALHQYGLPALAQNIGDVADNKTRFAVLGPTLNAKEDKQAPPISGKDATAIVIYPPGDRVGILEEILAVVSRDHGLSLTSIHSRPDRRGAFRFYMELEGHLHDENVRHCISALRTKLADDLAEILVFGSYPRRPFTPVRLKTIGIVGGTGKMGAWFKEFFEQAGYSVLIQGRTTKLTLEQCIEASEAVLINVPIDHSVNVASAVGPLLKPGQLVLDNTSVKGQVVRALLDAVPDGVEVLGMHTIFGPESGALRKRNVVFTRTDKSGPLAREFETIFYKHGARISYANEQTHDQHMAFHQNLEHFTKLVLAHVLNTQVDRPQDSRSYSSPNSKASLHTMARVLRLDTALLAEIQAHNISGPAMLRAYVENAQELLALIEAKDFVAVQGAIDRVKRQLGSELLDSLRQED